jgi:serine/threonine protein kinase/formylglycine-generating enzyme required for sulfatase activity
MSSRERDPLAAAADLCARFERGELGDDREAFLAAHPNERELIEAMLCATPDAEDAGGEPEHVGEFELVREVGRGGMGVVFEARMRPLRTRVALKLLAPHLAESPRAVARLRREALLASGLEHAGIARVLAFGEADGVCHLAMEFVDGTPLDAVLGFLTGCDPAALTADDLARALGAGHGPPTVWRGDYVRGVVDLCRQVADALAHASARVVIHRDVKPGNILVTRDGRAVLTDFGLAREVGRAGVTLSGEFAGTCAYAAPEQVDGKPDALDARTDVFSLGATLYELLTLQRAFDGESFGAVREQVLRLDPVRASVLNPRVGRDLSAVVDRALEKRREDRYDSAATLAQELADVLGGRPVRARPVSTVGRVRRWVQRNPRVSAAAAVVAVSAVVAVVALADAASSARGKADALEKYETARVDGLVRDVTVRGRMAVPAEPAVVAELADLASAAEGLIARIPELEARIAALRAEPAAGVERRGRLLHPLSERLAQAEYSLARMAGDLPDVGGVDRERFERRMAELAAWVDGARARIQASDQAVFARVEDQFLHDRLEEQLVAILDLRDFELPDLRARLLWASQLHADSVVGAAAAWTSAAARVRAHPRYGFALEPQLGLVPLGPDPDSGLEEFAHIRSGTVLPARDAAGRLQLGVDHGIVFVLVPGGTFRAVERADAVVLPFFLGKHELSRGQWERLAEGRPGLRLYDGGIIDLRNLTQLEKPANAVTWTMCAELLRREGLRLPWDAEWCWACDADGRWPVEIAAWVGRANVQDASQARARNEEQLAPFDDGVAGLASVWSFEPNEWGFHHLQGNVMEWCQDAFPVAAPDPVDPRARGTSAWSVTALRVRRGSAWNSGAWMDPPHRFDRLAQGAAVRDTGVRAARSLRPGPAG